MKRIFNIIFILGILFSCQFAYSQIRIRINYSAKEYFEDKISQEVERQINESTLQRKNDLCFYDYEPVSCRKLRVACSEARNEVNKSKPEEFYSAYKWYLDICDDTVTLENSYQTNSKTQEAQINDKGIFYLDQSLIKDRVRNLKDLWRIHKIADQGITIWQYACQENGNGCIKIFKTVQISQIVANNIKLYKQQNNTDIVNNIVLLSVSDNDFKVVGENLEINSMLIFPSTTIFSYTLFDDKIYNINPFNISSVKKALNKVYNELKYPKE